MAVEDALSKLGFEDIGDEEMNPLEDPGLEPQNYVDLTGDEAEVEDKEEAGESASGEATEDKPEGDTLDKTFEDLFKEKYGEEYDIVKKDEYSSLKAKAEAERLEDMFEEESLGLLKNVATSGLDWKKIKNIADVQTLDIESLSPLESIAKQLQLESGLTKEEINLELREFKKLEKVDLDVLDEDDLEEHYAKKAKFSRLEREAKKYLGSLKDQDDYKLPVLKDNSQASEEALKAKKAEYEELVNRYESEVSKFVSEKNEIGVELGEDDTFNFKLSEDQKTKVQDLMKNVNNLHTLFMTDNGADYNKMMSFIAGGLYHTDMLKARDNTSSNKGEERAIKSINNVDLGAKDKTSGGSGKKSLLDQVREFHKS